MSAGNVSTFISIRLTNGQLKSGLVCAAAIDNHADCRDDAAMGAHDIDCLLHAAAAGDDVFDHNEFLVRQNLKTAAQDEFAFVFLRKNVAFA